MWCDREIVYKLRQIQTGQSKQDIILAGLTVTVHNIFYELQDLKTEIQALTKALVPRLTKIQLSIGEPVPVTLAVGQKTTAQVVGLDQFNNPFPIDFTANPATFVDSDPTVASDAPVPTSGDDVITGVAAGTITLSVTCAGLSTSDTVTVPQPPAVLTSLKVNFSTPA